MLPSSCPFYRLISRVPAAVRAVEGPGQWGTWVFLLGTVPGAVPHSLFRGTLCFPLFSACTWGCTRAAQLSSLSPSPWVHCLGSENDVGNISQDSGVAQMPSQGPCEPCLSRAAMSLSALCAFPSVSSSLLQVL